MVSILILPPETSTQRIRTKCSRSHQTTPTSKHLHFVYWRVFTFRLVIDIHLCIFLGKLDLEIILSSCFIVLRFAGMVGIQGTVITTVRYEGLFVFLYFFVRIQRNNGGRPPESSFYWPEQTIWCESRFGSGFFLLLRLYLPFKCGVILVIFVLNGFLFSLLCMCFFWVFGAWFFLVHPFHACCIPLISLFSYRLLGFPILLLVPRPDLGRKVCQLFLIHHVYTRKLEDPMVPYLHHADWNCGIV